MSLQVKDYQRLDKIPLEMDDLIKMLDPIRLITFDDELHSQRVIAQAVSDLARMLRNVKD